MRFLVGLVLVASLALPAQAQVRVPCHRPTVKATIWCAVHHYGSVPGGVRTAVAIAWRESRFNPHATSPTGCAGVMQFAPSTWATLVRSWPLMRELFGDDVYNPRANVMYAIRLVHETQSWGPWS